MGFSKRGGVDQRADAPAVPMMDREKRGVITPKIKASLIFKNDMFLPQITERFFKLKILPMMRIRTPFIFSI